MKIIHDRHIIDLRREGAGRYKAFLQHADGGRERIGQLLGRVGHWTAEDTKGRSAARHRTRSGAVAALIERHIGLRLNTSAATLYVGDGAGGYAVANPTQVLEAARSAADALLRCGDPVFDSPRAVSEFLIHKLAAVEHEIFAVLFLDAQHRLIAYEEMFRGTLCQTSVYPREVVKRALHYNAGACVLAHQHPSLNPEPSRADELLTASLRQALALVDVRVLDHIVIGGTRTVSLAERGLL